MSNLDPPRDPLETWLEYGHVRIGVRVPRGCDYVLATLLAEQARDLALSLLQTLGITRAEVPRSGESVSGGLILPTPATWRLVSDGEKGPPAPEAPHLNKGGGDHGTDGPYCRVCHVVHVAPHTYYRDCKPCAICAAPTVNKGGAELPAWELCAYVGGCLKARCTSSVQAARGLCCQHAGHPVEHRR